MKIRRTVLLTKEMDDNQEDFINIDIDDFIALGKTHKANLMYKLLLRSEAPVFSGSVDHRMNLLDFKKLKHAFRANR
jgi:hypothetical protein